MESIFTDLPELVDSLNWFVFCGLLGIYFTVDSLYAIYTLTVTEHKPIQAATSGALIHLLLAVGVLSYVDNFLYIIPIMIGSWFGTYNIVSRKRFTAIKEA